MTYPPEPNPQAPGPTARSTSGPGRATPQRMPARDTAGPGPRDTAGPLSIAPPADPQSNEPAPTGPRDGGDGPRDRGPGQRGYANAADVAGKSWTEVVYWFALALAAAADIAAFHQVVSLVMRDQGDALIWLMVIGLTVIALTLAHFAGRLARDATAKHGTATWKQVYACAIPWTVLGLAAFAVRLLVADSSGGTIVDGSVIGGDGAGQSVRQISGAVLFLALYVGSGAVAAVGEYLNRNPLRAGYRRALRSHSRALDRLSRSQPPYELALQVYRQRARIRAREEANWQAARELRLAQADELKRYAAVLIASHLQDPSVTEAMTLPDRRPIAATTEATRAQGPRRAISAGRKAIGFRRRPPVRRPAIEATTEQRHAQADEPRDTGRKAG